MVKRRGSLPRQKAAWRKGVHARAAGCAAAGAGEAAGQDAALEVAAQLAFDATRDRHTVDIALAPVMSTQLPSAAAVSGTTPGTSLTQIR
jgi:hypothetical protein